MHSNAQIFGKMQKIWSLFCCRFCWERFWCNAAYMWLCRFQMNWWNHRRTNHVLKVLDTKQGMTFNWFCFAYYVTAVYEQEETRRGKLTCREWLTGVLLDSMDVHWLRNAQNPALNQPVETVMCSWTWLPSRTLWLRVWLGKQMSVPICQCRFTQRLLKAEEQLRGSYLEHCRMLARKLWVTRMRH